MIESIDGLIEIKTFKILKPITNDSKLKKSLKLLSVFGTNGNSVIFVTKEDNVYVFGHNRYGCLGLGIWDEDIPEPRLNETLSGKELANIYYGFSHVIGVTRDGLCYGWGGNDFGQLGIGSVESSITPKLIKDVPKDVVDMSCGNRHTLALTREGRVYAWGCNTFGQLGDGTTHWKWTPIEIILKRDFVSISCGKCHSIGLTSKGRLYLWGFNDFGQLGRHKDVDLKAHEPRAYNPVPQVIPNFRHVIKKAVCGPNHTLVLTTEGFLYSFGLNERGQIGNGCFETQYTPIRIKEDLKFKDILSVYYFDMSIAVSEDDQYFNWGYHSLGFEKITTPLDISIFVRRFRYTLLDLYPRFSRVMSTYRTVVFGDNNQTFDRNICIKNLDLNHSNGQQITGSSVVDNNCHSIPQKVFQKHLIEVFDNQNDYDLKFIINEKVIHCHKMILKIRNYKFWQKCEQLLSEQKSHEIQINGYSYEAFYAFIQWLYGMTPEINDQNCRQLSQLADIYSEPVLKSRCPQLNDNVIDLHNFCTLYKTAINDNITDLKNSCVEFAKSNWKMICKTQEFEDMNEDICKQLIISVFK